MLFAGGEMERVLDAGMGSSRYKLWWSVKGDGSFGAV